MPTVDLGLSLRTLRWTCKSCRLRIAKDQQALPQTTRRGFSNSVHRRAEVQIQAAPEIDLNRPPSTLPARIIPASPSYFTATPTFNDDFLKIQDMVRKTELLPTLPPEQVPKIAWLKLIPYRTQVGEFVPASKYSRVMDFLSQLNRIHPHLRPKDVISVLEKFRRPGSDEAPRAKPGVIDAEGRAVAMGRRKESSARVYLMEGTGEVLVNGAKIIKSFPRIHDRESALWPLQATERMDKYNVYALVRGGGKTGQAESITLAIAKALLVHEPALKPALRKGKPTLKSDVVAPALNVDIAGCMTRDPRAVERKKPGRVKARKMPTWVKR